MSEIISRCRYCGRNYSYEGLVDPLTCGQKSCKFLIATDVFVTEKTSAGDSAIQPIVFGGHMSRKIAKKGKPTKEIKTEIVPEGEVNGKEDKKGK